MGEQPDKLSCGAVLVRKTESGWVTLMLRAYRNWDFPKGIREAGESPMQAAVREVGEETGITDLSFDWGERFTDTGPYNQGKVARYFLARTEEEEVEMGISPELGRPEQHQYRWIAFDSAYDISSPRVRLVVRWARQVIGT
ncbi:MAG: NUDIX domain-containing protein [Proteobacteria bacterium]|nr:NUDIX domain-containing protein [Pseudomonadota bacterium]